MLNEYLSILKATGKSDRTIATRKAQLNSFLFWLKETTESDNPLEITSIDAVKYRKYLQNKGLKPNSINIALSSINSFCQWMYDDRKMSHNPVKKVEQIGIAKTAPRGLSKNEKHRLLRAIENSKNKRDGAIILTLLDTGVRVSELISLTVDDVVIGDRKGMITVRAGKGNKFRQIPLRKELRNFLVEYIFNNRSLGEYLFEGQRAPSLTSRAVQLICNKFGEKAKIDRLTPHVLRHTFAHDLLGVGVSLDKVALLLGHSSLNTTAIYTRPSMNDLQDAVDKIEYV
ncbi:tyrosine-type recombinase/integrase [Pelosinus sp. IPA-1]|uniref:tyrosine-type recombinase/integrase n=1 Tax=Pelosinus sp. IPA-1 TaxID=3029569 RepID=UPI0024362991|nr:tyrosine-type recombinase/integrase [Pelosinus sp. IPA-1]GMB00909.1 recombinase XerC [Pelosinus sp. IPA-1]